MGAVDPLEIDVFLASEMSPDAFEFLMSWGGSLRPSCAIRFETDITELSSTCSGPAVVFVDAPVVSLANAIQGGQSPSAALQEWETRTRKLLEQVAKIPAERLVLMDVQALRRRPNELLGRLAKHFLGSQSPETSFAVSEDTLAAPFFLMIAQCLLQSQARASALYDQLAGRVDQGFLPQDFGPAVLDNLVEEFLEKDADAREKTLISAIVGQLHGELERFGTEAAVWQAISEAADTRTDMIQAQARLREGALGAALLDIGAQLDTVRGRQGPSAELIELET